MSWLFPDKPIFVEAPCLDCGELARVTVRNGVIECEEPRGTRFYVDVPRVSGVPTCRMHEAA